MSRCDYLCLKECNWPVPQDDIKNESIGKPSSLINTQFGIWKFYETVSCMCKKFGEHELNDVKSSICSINCVCVCVLANFKQIFYCITFSPRIPCIFPHIIIYCCCVSCHVRITAKVLNWQRWSQAGCSNSHLLMGQECISCSRPLAT